MCIGGCGYGRRVVAGCLSEVFLLRRFGAVNRFLLLFGFLILGVLGEVFCLWCFLYIIVCRRNCLKTWNLVKAVEIFENLINVYPSDNIGARIKLAQCYLSLNKYKDILKLAAKYPEGASADVEYAAVLAALKLGDTHKGSRYLDKAINSAPLIAEILLLSLPKQPKAFHEANLICGSASEAYYYWLHNHLFWDENTLAFLNTKRDLIEQVKADRRNNWGSAFPPKERGDYPAIFSLQASGVC